MQKLPKKLAKKLAGRAEENCLRVLPKGHSLVDFSSNDYLGFARNPSVKKHIENYYKKSAALGATGSRLLSGNHELYSTLEALLCDYHNATSALVFNSGYDANLGFFGAIPQRNDIIFYDELCHASIRDGIQLSHAKGIKFKHNDLDDLAKVLERNKIDGDDAGYVVTESVFSMDGDSPDLKELVNFCVANQLHLVIDEAHAIGVFENGLIARLGLQNGIFTRIITFGKALGSHGAAVLGSEALKSYLVNFARSLIYTTGLPPHSLATTLAAYEILMGEVGNEAMLKLKKLIAFFQDEVKKHELVSKFLESNSAIQICSIGGNSATKKVSEQLQVAGFDIKPILAPTVPSGKERLRICLHAFNTKEEVVKVLEIIKGAI